MKNVRIWFLLIFLGNSCFSDPLVLSENVDKVVVERSATIYPYYHYIPENDRIKLILNKEKIKFFINDINNCGLVLNPEIHQDISETPFCYEIKIYSRNVLIATFRTDGIYFYYEGNKSSYNCGKNLLKYWGNNPYVSEENSCL
jgi:hypothetical protein